MTNVMGRYPVHFHHQVPAKGEVSMMVDCSVHTSYFRAISVHNAFNLRVQRNTAFDITGHAFYLGEFDEWTSLFAYCILHLVWFS